MSDNYARAKSVFSPMEGDGEKDIEEVYDDIDAAFQQVLAKFGLKRVEVSECVCLCVCIVR